MQHESLMQHVFELAKRGIGTVSPNPLVGAILVKEGKIIGEGWHEKAGEAHAEVNAILDAKNKGHEIIGSTLYVNLEPCSHLNKKTPPCAPLIIQNKISEVYISNLDPNPRVFGNGVALLREHGIKVNIGLLEQEGAKLNEIFFKFIKTGLPFVHVKLAQTLDGKIALSDGSSKYISGVESQKLVHHWRAEYDAILVGAKTFMVDNPRLTIRHQVNGKKQPWRIVLGSLNRLDITKHLVSDEFKHKTIFITKAKDYIKHASLVKELTDHEIQVIPLKDQHGRIDLKEVLKELADRKITSILVEGGQNLASQFLEQNLYDKFSLFIAPKIMGDGEASVKNLGIKSMQDLLTFKSHEFKVVGSDVLFSGYAPNGEV